MADNFGERLKRLQRDHHLKSTIGIEQVWHTKWWPKKKFTFICSVVEANAVYSRPRGRKVIPEPQLEFRRKLALGMLENNLDYEGMSTKSPILSKKWSIGPGIPGNDAKFKLRLRYRLPPTGPGVYGVGLDNRANESKFLCRPPFFFQSCSIPIVSFLILFTSSTQLFL